MGSDEPKPIQTGILTSPRYIPVKFDNGSWSVFDNRVGEYLSDQRGLRRAWGKVTAMNDALIREGLHNE